MSGRVRALRHRPGRRGAAIFTAGLLAVGAIAGGATTAAAQDSPRGHGGATATLGGLRTAGDAVIRDEDGPQQVRAGLFEMSVDNGGTLLTYCIDIHNPTQRDARYQETGWSGTSLNGNRNAGRIRWILQHSYPQVNDLGALAKKAGARSLTEQDAAAGTQVAIWRYSDNAKVTATDPAAEKLADYLQHSARNLPEPNASLTLGPAAVSGHPGEKIGPVTVHTNADGVSVAPPADSAASGVTVVGKDGKPVTSAADGSKLYFDVPEHAMDGTAALTVQASTTVPVGRAFTSETRSQTQILAGSSESTVTATASANWAEGGPIPALSAEKDCAKGGLDITAANTGDEEFTFSLMGFRYVVAAGESQTVTIPLQEDQAYDFTLTGPNGYARTFKGVLDCKTQGGPRDVTAQLASGPGTAAVGGTAEGDLADSGSSSSTPTIAMIAIVLVLVGGAAMFFVRRKSSQAESEDKGSAED